MTPAIGRIVHLRLSAQCADEINRARAGNGDTAAESAITHAGGLIRKGNTVREGDEYPLVITRVWDGGGVNGQVLLDGNDTLWATSVVEGTEPGTWHWPERIE